MKLTGQARVKTYERDGRRCAACGSTSDLTIQHRVNRQMGGSRLRDGFAFWLTLCWGCNTALETDARFAESGRANGWKLSTWEEPTEVAVFVMWAREWRLLDAHGEFTVVDGRGPHGMEGEAA